MSLPATLLRHSERTPDKVFLEVWDEEAGVTQTLTYRELADSMMSAAQWLRAATGLQRGEYCAMLAHNSAGYLSISLGAMALGAISLNLNWRQPESTTQVLLEDLKPKVLVASKPFKAEAHAMHQRLGIKMVLIESICSQEGPPFEPSQPEHAASLSAAILQTAEPNAVAAVFFTGGTTGTPKAVPHTHAALLWLAEQQLRLFKAPFAPEAGALAGTVCFTPFFHVMGFCANFVFNLHAGIRAFVLSKHETKLSPRLVLKAIAQLRPTCVNTVPWIVEGLVELVKSGTEDAAETLRVLQLLTYGGAALPSHCAPVIAELGVTLACTYGQTELAGPVMFGKPGGDPNALRPLPGVSFEIVRGPDDAPNEGELILLGNLSSTAGYLKLQSESREYRSLTGDRSNVTTAQRFCTGDRFYTKIIDGETWLMYLCRADDLLVHTSGEMSNPLPTEQAMLAECAGIVDAACCCGSNMPRPLLLLELCEGYDFSDPEVCEALSAGLAAANAVQPGYSRVLKQHVLLAEKGSLPRTVKGTVQRNKAEALFAKDFAAIKEGLPPSRPTLAADQPMHSEDVYDSLALSSGALASKPSVNAMDHLIGLRTIGCLWIMMAHFASREVLVHAPFLDEFLEHAHVACSLFIILSGFGMYWGQSSFSLFPIAKGNACEVAKSAVASLLSWYISRMGRVVFCTWVTMLLTLILEAQLYGIQYRSSMISCFLFLETWFLGAQDFDLFPAWQRCPNSPAWYIAALVPCWLLFPFFLPISRACVRLPASWPLWMLLLLLCALSYLPVQSLINRNPPPQNITNYMFYFPPASLCDFFAGATAAALAKAHQATIKRWLSPTEVKASTLSARLFSSLPRAATSLLVDMCLVTVGFILFQPVAQGDRAVDVSARRSDASLYHLAALPASLYLYGSVATGGTGLSTALCRWPAFVSLGRYALYVYLLQMPFAELYAHILSGGTNLEQQLPRIPPWRSFAADAFTTYVFFLWLLSGLYAEFIETPFLELLDSCFTRLKRKWNKLPSKSRNI